MGIRFVAVFDKNYFDSDPTVPMTWRQCASYVGQSKYIAFTFTNFEGASSLHQGCLFLLDMANGTIIGGRGRLFYEQALVQLDSDGLYLVEQPDIGWTMQFSKTEVPGSRYAYVFRGRHAELARSGGWFNHAVYGQYIYCVLLADSPEILPHGNDALGVLDLVDKRHVARNGSEKSFDEMLLALALDEIHLPGATAAPKLPGLTLAQMGAIAGKLKARLVAVLAELDELRGAYVGPEGLHSSRLEFVSSEEALAYIEAADNNIREYQAKLAEMKALKATGKVQNDNVLKILDIAKAHDIEVGE